MEKDISLLTQICESAKAQRNLHAKLIHYTTDDALLKALASQFSGYHSILLDAQKLLMLRGCMRKIGLGQPRYVSLSLSLQFCKVSSRIAQIVMQESLLNIIDMARSVKTCYGAGEAALGLAERLQAMEEAHIGRMRAFL